MPNPNKPNRFAPRKPGGQPKNQNAAKEIKRKKHSGTFGPGTKELAQAIAKERGYAGWGYAMDEAIKKLAQEMGITV